MVTGLYDVKLDIIVSPGRFLHQYLAKQTADGAAKSCSFWEIVNKNRKGKKKNNGLILFPKKNAL